MRGSLVAPARSLTEKIKNEFKKILTAFRLSVCFCCGCLGVDIYRLGTPRGRAAELEERGSLVIICTFTNRED